MLHHCEPCNYSTNIHSNMIKHNKSSKHLEATKELSKGVLKEVKDLKQEGEQMTKEESKGPVLYACPNCPRKFTQLSNLAKHKKACNQNISIQLKTEYEKQAKAMEEKYQKDMMEMKEKYMAEINCLKEQIIEILKEDKKDFKDIAYQAGSIAKVSNNALAYAATHYNNAPAIHTFTNFKLLNKEKNYTLEEVMLHYYETGELPDYIGKIIKEDYQKDDPSQQEFWNTDSSRLAYIIREIIDNVPQWQVDKKGTKIKKYVIKPILDYIIKTMTKYLADRSKNPIQDDVDLLKFNENSQLAANLIDDCKKGKLAKEIIKSITPDFYLNKTKAIKHK